MEMSRQRISPARVLNRIVSSFCMVVVTMTKMRFIFVADLPDSRTNFNLCNNLRLPLNREVRTPHQHFSGCMMHKHCPKDIMQCLHNLQVVFRHTPTIFWSCSIGTPEYPLFITVRDYSYTPLSAPIIRSLAGTSPARRSMAHKPWSTQ